MDSSTIKCQPPYDTNETTGWRIISPSRSYNASPNFRDIPAQRAHQMIGFCHRSWLAHAFGPINDLVSFQAQSHKADDLSSGTTISTPSRTYVVVLTQAIKPRPTGKFWEAAQWSSLSALQMSSPFDVRYANANEVLTARDALLKFLSSAMPLSTGSPFVPRGRSNKRPLLKRIPLKNARRVKRRVLCKRVEARMAELAAKLNTNLAKPRKNTAFQQLCPRTGAQKRTLKQHELTETNLHRRNELSIYLKNHHLQSQ